MSHVANQTDFPLAVIPFVDTESGQLTDIWWQFLWILWMRTGQAAGNGTFVSGMELTWPGDDSSIPDGWLLEDGSAISREGFPLLFAVLGTKYGAGDGSTTFNLPDMRGRTALGADATHLLASSGGALAHTLAIAELPSHTHVISVTDPGHTHPGAGAASFVMDGAGTEYIHAAGVKGTTAAATGSNTTGVTAAAANTGSGNAFSTVSPYVAKNWIIKT